MSNPAWNIIRLQNVGEEQCFPLYDEKRSQTHPYRNVDPHFLGLRVYFVGTLERIQTRLFIIFGEVPTLAN